MSDNAPLTFLLTDVEGSTRLWDERPDTMRRINARHDALVTEVVGRAGGEVVRSRAEGDSAFAVFDDAKAAVAAALDLQRAVAAEAWADGATVRVRMALHSGAVEAGGAFYGPVVNRCARLRGIGHGGQTLLSGTTAALVGDALPAGARLVDRGEHRLKDLAQPEHVFELAHGDLAATFPPLRSVDVARNNLPRPASAFIGRDRDLAVVSALVDDHRLVTLVGPGGIGKTRLAVETARARLDHHGDGVWLVELAAISDEALVGQAVASSIGVRDQPGRPLAASIADHLAGKQALLVLDNCEHLTHAVAELVSSLLPAAPGVHVLAASREPLGVGGEYAHRVGVLDENASLELFFERAGDALDGERDHDEVAEICRRLDGIPLAIEMAAARAATLSLSEMLDGLIAGAGVDALRGTIEWSYRLLDDDERLVFRRLAPFAGDFNLDAVEHVVPADGGIDALDVLDVLARLVAKSLVQARERAADIRYRVLETIRQFAAEQLDAVDESQRAHTAHLDWYFDLTVTARAAAVEATGADATATTLAAFDLLDIEHDNVLAAMAWPGRNGTARHQVELASYLMEYWDARGFWSEGRAILERLAATETGVWKGRAQALSAAGVLAERMADLAGARRDYEAALGIWTLLQDTEEQRLLETSKVWLTMRLSQLARLAADYDDAWRFTEHSLQSARALDWGAGEVAALSSLAILELDRGHVVAAGAHAADAVALCRGIGDTSQLLDALMLLTNVVIASGDVDAALEYAAEAVELGATLGDDARGAAALADLAEAQRVAGAIEADANARIALDRLRAAGDQREAAQAATTLAALTRDRGNLVEAEGLALDAVTALADVGAPIERALAWCTLGSVRRAAGGDGVAEARHAMDALAAIPDRDRANVVRMVATLLSVGGKAEAEVLLATAPV